MMPHHRCGLATILGLCIGIHSSCFPGLTAKELEACDAEDRVVVTIAGNGQEGSASPDGPGQDTPLSQPFGIVKGPDGALYICEVGSHLIRRLDLNTGALTTSAGTGRKGYSGDGGPATSAELNEPYEVRFDSSGNMLFVEMQNHVVRRVDRESGIITTVAGTGTAGFSGDGGPAVRAQLNQPHSIVLDDSDRIYICDIRNHRIRIVDPETGRISTFAGTGERSATPDGSSLAGTALNGPRALDFDRRNQSLYLALREGNALYRIDLKTETIHHLAGTGKSGYSGDGGDGRQAALSGPKGVSLSENGDVYFADTESHTIRVLRRQSGFVETVIGDGRMGDGPDGEPRTCRLNRPHGVFVSADGWLFVGDSSNHRVRRMKIGE